MAKNLNSKQDNKLKECTLYVDGMHCASCELLIERKLIKKDGIEAVDASTKDGKVIIEYKGDKPDLASLNKEFKETGYKFLDHKPKRKSTKLFEYSNGGLTLNKEKAAKVFKNFLIAIGLIIAFLWFERSGVAASFTPTSGELNPGAFFAFGLGAGASTCAALVGGLLLSLSKNWNEKYIEVDNKLTKLIPHGLFHLGRLVSFAVVGAVIAFIGGSLENIIKDASIFIALFVALVMFIMAGQMLEWEWTRKFQLTLPKSFGRFAAKQEDSKGGIAPFFTGFFSFLIPCGLTITAFTLAIQSENPMTGALNMLFFALGTLIFLGIISLAAVGFNSKPIQVTTFNKVSGILLLFFALFTFNAQIIAINAKYGTSIPNTETIAELFKQPDAPLANTSSEGFQEISMKVDGIDFVPAKFTVQAGTPVRFTIDGTKASGCTSRLMGKGIFKGQVNVLGKVQTIEFTPTKKGRMPFSCWMGMANGVIEVI